VLWEKYEPCGVRLVVSIDRFTRLVEFMSSLPSEMTSEVPFPLIEGGFGNSSVTGSSVSVVAYQ